MSTSTRMIAIDDQIEHLNGLVKGLSLSGHGCLQIHFNGAESEYAKCPHVRVIFSDLHLFESGTTDSDAVHFSTLLSVIQKISPNGPYLLVLWTNHPQKAFELEKYITTRAKEYQPIAVRPLSKHDWLDNDGNVLYPNELNQELQKILAEQKTISCLTDWEDSVLSATGKTIEGVVALAKDVKTQKIDMDFLRKILCNLGFAALGEKQAPKSAFRSISEALLPILADQLSRDANPEHDKWSSIFEGASNGNGAELTNDNRADLNRMLNLERLVPSTTRIRGSDRGAVFLLPDEYSGDSFECFWGLAEDQLGQTCYGRNPSSSKSSIRWMLIQIDAACDSAQRANSPKPYLLAAELDADSIGKNTLPAALWKSPILLNDGKLFYLHANCRFQVWLPDNFTRRSKALYRIREAMLNDIIYFVNTHKARPGIIRFELLKGKQKSHEDTNATKSGQTKAKSGN